MIALFIPAVSVAAPRRASPLCDAKVDSSAFKTVFSVISAVLSFFKKTVAPGRGDADGRDKKAEALSCCAKVINL